MHRKKIEWYCLMMMLILAMAFPAITTASEPDPGYVLYTVQPGDTLSEIAKKYDTTVENILHENGITEASFIAGKVIRISSQKPAEKGDRSGITLEMRDADIRDVLSTLAVVMKKNIIYTEAPMQVSLSVRDVTPTKALEILTQSIGMSSVTEGNLVLVGSSENITRNFYSMLPITRFSLSYLSPEQINTQVQKLGIPVQQIILDSSSKYIWAQGTPQALSKMRELVAVLDREENIDPITQEIEKALELTAVELEYVASDVIRKLIEQLDIPCKTIIFETNPWTIWVQADETAMRDIHTLVQSVDIAENKVPEVVEEEEEEEEVIDTTRIEAKKMMNITSARLMPLIEGLDIPVKVIAIDSSGYNIWMRGDRESINLMNDLINRLDNYFSRDDVNFFIYTLENVKAATAIEKLNFIGLQDVQVMSLNYPQFSRDLLITCPADRINDVKNVLRKLDVPGERVRAVVDASTTSNARSRLEARRDLIVQLTGIPKDRFQVSQNISKTDQPLYVLWVDETPDNVKLIQDVVKSLDGLAGSENSTEAN